MVCDNTEQHRTRMARSTSGSLHVSISLLRKRLGARIEIMNDRIARMVTPSRRDFRMNAGTTPLGGN